MFGGQGGPGDDFPFGPFGGRPVNGGGRRSGAARGAPSGAGAPFRRGPFGDPRMFMGPMPGPGLAGFLNFTFGHALGGGGGAFFGPGPGESLDQIAARLFAEYQPVERPTARAVIDTLPVVPITAADVAAKKQCSVCLEEFKAGEAGVVSLPCSHFLHRPCIEPWLQHNNTCPVCRMELPTEREAAAASGAASSGGGRGAAAAAPSRPRPTTTIDMSADDDDDDDVIEEVGGPVTFADVIGGLFQMFAGGAPASSSGSSSSSGGGASGAAAARSGGGGRTATTVMEDTDEEEDFAALLEEEEHGFGDGYVRIERSSRTTTTRSGRGGGGGYGAMHDGEEDEDDPELAMAIRASLLDVQKGAEQGAAVPMHTHAFALPASSAASASRGEGVGASSSSFSSSVRPSLLAMGLEELQFQAAIRGLQVAPGQDTDAHALRLALEANMAAGEGAAAAAAPAPAPMAVRPSSSSSSSSSSSLASFLAAAGSARAQPAPAAIDLTCTSPTSPPAALPADDFATRVGGVPPEPALTDATSFTLRLRLPDGSTLTRGFAAAATVAQVVAFVASSEKGGLFAQDAGGRPLLVLREVGGGVAITADRWEGLTLGATGWPRRATLFVERAG